MLGAHEKTPPPCEGWDSSLSTFAWEVETFIELFLPLHQTPTQFYLHQIQKELCSGVGRLEKDTNFQ